MKIIAAYLPQFHNIPENDEWWGDGFTEWVNVKNAKPMFEGHKQPRVPLNNNYYNLLDDDVKIWQAKLAKEYGVYGFMYYHYWFNGKMLLEKPMEQMLANKDVDIPFCICWANEAWTTSWVGDTKKILIKQSYGKEKEWKEHFDYLLPFFKDPRYIYEDGKPLVVLYRPHIIDCLGEMVAYWKQLAVEAGLPGLVVVSQNLELQTEKLPGEKYIDRFIEYQPTVARNDLSRSNNRFVKLKKLRRDIARYVDKHFGIDLLRVGQSTLSKLNQMDRIPYEDAWGAILKRTPVSPKNYPGAFVRWDNSPRHKERARIYYGETPEKFEKYMTQQIRRARDVYHKDKIFIYAWNEWAEGGYLEPDEEYGYGYLEAIRNALNANGEFPEYTTK